VFVKEFDKQLKFWRSQKPLFSYISFQAVHDPLTPQKKFLDMYADIYGQISECLKFSQKIKL
jgi:hypothetical protein